MASNERAKLYSVGECPVCFDSGAVTVLKAMGVDAFLYYCPLCGLAWTQPPTGGRLDEINEIKALAPNGVALPGEQEVRSLNFPLTDASSLLPLLRNILNDEL